MERVRVTKEFTLDTAHALHNYDGKCRFIHGHTYHLSVTVSGFPDADPAAPEGMVMDFGELKRIVNHLIVDTFDHALVLSRQDPRAALLRETEERIVVVDYQPTAENMLLDFVRRIKKHLSQAVTLERVFLRETPTSYAEWLASDSGR